jgi:hypothetical protein
MDEQKIEISTKLINNEITEFISKKPHWAVRQGNMILLFTIILVIIILGAIPHQEILDVNAQLQLRNNHYFVKLLIPQASVSKVSLEQTVLITFDALPVQEYGKEKSKIKAVDRNASPTGFFAWAPIGNKLDLSNKIVLNENLKIKAEIILQEHSLLLEFLPWSRHIL